MNDVESLGCKRMIMKSCQEAVLKALRAKVNSCTVVRSSLSIAPYVLRLVTLLLNVAFARSKRRHVVRC